MNNSIKDGKSTRTSTIATPTRADVYKVFQPHLAAAEGSNGEYESFTPRITSQYQDRIQAATRETHLCRNEFFAPDTWPKVPDMQKGVDRIPYLWDFGLILARKDFWERCTKEKRLVSTKSQILTVEEVWNSLCLPHDAIGNGSVPANSEITWSQFIDACRIVGQQSGMISFDVDLNTAESLSSLVLEMWGSISFKMYKKKSQFAKLCSRRAGGFHKVLKHFCVRRNLLFFLLVSSFLAACGHLTSEKRQMKRDNEGKEAVASREWYSTSAAIIRQHKLHQFCVLRLPGQFATRGDWFLAMAKGSRSELLGHRAMDMLSSRRMCMLRLHDGLGLPPREILPDP